MCDQPLIVSLKAGRVSTGQPCTMERGTDILGDVQYTHSIGAGNSNGILWKKTDNDKIAQHSTGLANRTGLHKWRIQGNVLFVLLSFPIPKASMRLQHTVLAAREEM